jgi:hypothetical protein
MSNLIVLFWMEDILAQCYKLITQVLAKYSNHLVALYKQLRNFLLIQLILGEILLLELSLE